MSQAFILSGPAFILWSAPASGFHTGVRVQRPRPGSAFILHLVLPPDGATDGQLCLISGLYFNNNNNNTKNNQT